MRFQNRLIALSLFVTAGCTALPDDGDIDPPNPGVLAQGLATTFTFDSTALAKIPPATIPAAALTLDKLSEKNIASRLLGATDAPVPVDTQGPSQRFKTALWEFEKDATTGRVVGFSSAKPGAPVVLTDDQLKKQALGRVSSYGIGTGETGKVLQRKALAQSLDGTVLGKPSLHSHKTFVFRGVNGVQVVGHRAVVTAGADGSVRKVLLHWPALAKSGHTLRTALTTPEIEQRAAAALQREGESTGKVSLSWRYLPVRAPTGEVSLKLAVAAHLGGGAVDKDGSAEEARVVDVDVSAQ